jgi:hypothetical protein
LQRKRNLGQKRYFWGIDPAKSPSRQLDTETIEAKRLLGLTRDSTRSTAKVSAILRPNHLTVPTPPLLTHASAAAAAKMIALYAACARNGEVVEFDLILSQA